MFRLIYTYKMRSYGREKEKEKKWEGGKERKEERKKRGERKKERKKRERKRKRKKKERKFRAKIQRDLSPLQILLVCSSINKVRGSEVKLLYINLDKLMGFILIFYLFWLIYYSIYFHLTYFHLLSSYIYFISSPIIHWSCLFIYFI